MNMLAEGEGDGPTTFNDEDEYVLERRGHIEQTFAKLKEKGEKIVERRRTIARVNESFYAGDQYVAMTVQNGVVGIDKNAWFDEEGVPRIAVNLFTGLLMTWSALITASAPTVKAKASGTGPEKQFRAAFGQKVIRFLQQELDTKSLFGKVVQLAAQGGTAGAKVVYDPDEDRIEACTLSVHDFILDPSNEDTRKARWVIFQDHIDMEEALELYQSDGVHGREPAEEPYKNAAGDDLMGVLREELWMLPTKRFPRGLYACFVSGECVQECDNPISYMDDSGKERFMLPGVFMKVRENRASPYGTTNFTDAVGMQRSYNETVARVQLFIRKTSHPYLLMPAEVPNFDAKKISALRFKSVHWQAATAARWLETPAFPQHVFAQRDFFEVKMEKVVGLNAVTTGTQTSATMSGKLAEHLVELDQNRNADCTRSMQAMIVEFFKLSLTLMRRYYVSERQMAIADADEEDVISFSRADIVGIDVTLETASETENLEDVAAEKFALRQQQGLGQPGDANKLMQPQRVGLTKRVVEELWEAFKAGEEFVELPGTIDWDVVDEFIEKIQSRTLASRDLDTYVLSVQFREWLQELERAQPEPQPQPGAPTGQPDANAALTNPPAPTPGSVFPNVGGAP